MERDQPGRAWDLGPWSMRQIEAHRLIQSGQPGETGAHAHGTCRRRLQQPPYRVAAGRAARLGLAARREERMGCPPEAEPSRARRCSTSRSGATARCPEHPTHRSMAPRGADIEPGTPDMGYILNDKADVWADNTRELYEEAVARQWSATRDIPWGELQELDDDVEHAMCQLCTLLTEVEMIAADLPAKWMWRMNHEFIEAKMFLCTQIMDEARHAEVFRKRALANGGGLLLSRNGAHEPAAHDHRGQVVHAGDRADAPARRGVRARPLPHGRADRAERRREADLPDVHAGRGAPRRVRHDAHPVLGRARSRRRRGDPRGARPRRDGAHRVRHRARRVDRAGRAARRRCRARRGQGLPDEPGDVEEAVQLVPRTLRAGRHQPAGAHEDPARHARHRHRDDPRPRGGRQ